MRKKETLSNDWLQKTYRIKPDTILLYEYLEFYATSNGISKDTLFDDIINFSIDYVKANDLNVSVKEYKPIRTVKGFTLKTETLAILKDFSLKHREFLLCEIVEYLIGVYARTHLTENEISMLRSRNIDV